jgi:predicted LPLAT superfamily acyltransferase
VSWRPRFNVRGVFWRQFLRWAVLNVPAWAEPSILSFWTALFMFWHSGRRAVMHNLAAVLPGSSAFANFFRTYVVMWNFAWSISDNVRFKELRVTPDWEFSGIEHFEALQAQAGGAIILTAHMGNYDVGAQLFAETSDRKIVMIRAPEVDPRTQIHEKELHRRTVGEARVKVDFSGSASDLAIDLLHALQNGELVAIQGDRITPGIASMPATLFGKPSEVPAGPFALAMAARVPIYPLFIVRLGWRRYRLVTRAPIEVMRTRDRNEAFSRAVEQWTRELESVGRETWYQWFNFVPFYPRERAA